MTIMALLVPISSTSPASPDAPRAVGSMEELLRWERMASRLQREQGISSVCHYDQRRLTSTEADVIAVEHSGSAPYQMAAALPADGRITVMNLPRQVRRVIDLAGFGHSRVMVMDP